MQGAPQNPVLPAASWRSLPAAGQRAGPSLPPRYPKTRPTLKNLAAFLPKPGTSGDLRGERLRCFRACGRAPMPGTIPGRAGEAGHPPPGGGLLLCLFEGKKKKKLKCYFLLRQSEGSHSPSHEKRRLAKIRGNWRQKPVCGDRRFKDPAELHWPPCPPLSSFPPPAQRREMLQRGPGYHPSSYVPFTSEKAPPKALAPRN